MHESRHPIPVLVTSFLALAACSQLPTDPSNQPAMAMAGDDQVVTDVDGGGNEPVVLDGSASFDSDGQIEVWSWRQGSLELATTAVSTVTLPLGTHTLTLFVTDDDGAQSSDTVVVTVAPAGTGGGSNQPPVANAGMDQQRTDSDGNGSEAVTLSGTGSFDPDGTLVSWVWRKGENQIATGATAGVTLAVGIHTVKLTVTDDDGATDTDTVIITVNGAGGGNQPPVADAGPDQTVTDTDGSGFELVQMDGSATHDPDGSIASAEWSVGGTVLGNGKFPKLNLAVGTHTVVLTVIDNAGAQDTDSVVVTVLPQGG